MESAVAPLVFVDLETAGGEPRRNPIIQVAAIAVDSRLHIESQLEIKLQFDRRQATLASLRKAHYQARVWREEAIPPQEAAWRLADFLRAHAARQLSGRRNASRSVELVAHHAVFDAPFLQTWFRRQRVFLPAHPQWLCTLQRARWYFAERPELPLPASFRLAALCQYFEIPFHAADAHHALGDARAMLALYRRLAERSERAKSPTPSRTKGRIFAHARYRR